ncbi:hypothetical protein [Reichenbachiella sp.]|uniref:hypothetical protein n=1 Tax=Reichenbachiella sp. TaxID=2184521 RepID=UPI003298736C
MFLNKEKKAWYMKDFEALLLRKDLDCEIIEHLVSINKSENIQTLYSAYFARKKVSYLKICFTKDAELTLVSTLKTVEEKYNNSSNEQCYFRSYEPKSNPMYDPDYPKGMLYYDSPEYLRIKHFQIFFEAEFRQRHSEFWESLKDQLG